LLNLLGDETVPAIVKEDATEAKTVEFEGLTLKVIKSGHELVVDALDDWGNKVLGHVRFNIGDNKELDPQDLSVDEKYQGQGIARVMYDYIKSQGYTIVRSWDQTDAGAGFWNKHRGEDVRVWENFADGKNPGRKGLSKRVGVNTKASVSSLRNTAKHSSGEKQRMAHWLANMKAGRAKAKRK
jgi:GNAT superfamily N-acetyltransferase